MELVELRAQLAAATKERAALRGLLIPALAYCDTNNPEWLARLAEVRAALARRTP